MTNTMKSFIAAIAASLIAFAGFNAYAANRVIDQAKTECVIGEQIDGYLGKVTGKAPSTEVNREVRSVNQQRKAVYADLARKNGTTVDVTAQLTAQKLISKAPRGHCVQNKDKSWRTK